MRYESDHEKRKLNYRENNPIYVNIPTEWMQSEQFMAFVYRLLHVLSI